MSSAFHGVLYFLNLNFADVEDITFQDCTIFLVNGELCRDFVEYCMNFVCYYKVTVNDLEDCSFAPCKIMHLLGIILKPTLCVFD